MELGDGGQHPGRDVGGPAAGCRVDEGGAQAPLGRPPGGDQADDAAADDEGVMGTAGRPAAVAVCVRSVTATRCLLWAVMVAWCVRSVTVARWVLPAGVARCRGPAVLTRGAWSVTVARCLRSVTVAWCVRAVVVTRCA
ncbi:hypothetical protein [Streptomyces hygroscopicus]|uniref:hypothetical protein n=1 Tax=Streptomyces hygroscopicus TaxID=1912 RepID=UPI003787A844